MKIAICDDEKQIRLVLSDALQNAFEASEVHEKAKVSIKTVVRSRTFLINIKNRIVPGVLFS